jgi:hypothetical protein
VNRQTLTWLVIGAALYYAYLSFGRHMIGGNPLRPVVVAAA